MPFASPRYLASGNINPSVVVMADPTKNFHVLQATGPTVKPVGVSQEGTYYPMGTPYGDGYAAHAEQPITVWGEATECLLTAGATVTAGDHIKCDANGYGETILFTQTAASLIYRVGIALESAVVGQKFRIQVMIGDLPGISA